MLRLHVEAHNEARNEDNETAIRLAWLTAYFHRIERLKPVTAYLKADTPAAQQSLAEQLKASLRSIRPQPRTAGPRADKPSSSSPLPQPGTDP